MAHILELVGPTPNDGQHMLVDDTIWRAVLTGPNGQHDYRVTNRTVHHVDPEEGLPVYLAILCQHPSMRRP